VPKVQHKPIKSPRKGSNKKSKRQPKAALDWGTGLSGVPPDSVRCITGECPVHQGDQLQTCHLREFGKPLRYNSPDCPCCTGLSVLHRTVRVAPDCPCCTGLSGVPSGATIASAMVEFNGRLTTLQCADCACRSQSRRMMHRTVNMTCPVHHQTVRWPTCKKLQRSNPNAWVTWLAHRTVSGAPVDSRVPQRPFWWLGL
jgi:hypothetical protein